MMLYNTKEILFEREEKGLSKYAAKSSSEFLTQRAIPCKADARDDDNVEFRMPFARDRDRIVHSRAFRRLMHKTQIFNANLGDHYRNRLTHTLEVNQIARSIGSILGLNDGLIEAIALGHDLGHTPFGHIGERTLHNIISGKTFKEGKCIIENVGGFKHNFQGLQVVDKIETTGVKQRGMGLTLAVREGILKHTSSKIKIPYKDVDGRNKKIGESINYAGLDLNNINIDLPSFTLEGQVVAIADEIAQCTHDIEDGLRAGVLSLTQIKEDELVDRIINEYKINISELESAVDIRTGLIKFMVGYLIHDVSKNSSELMQNMYPNDIEIPTFKNKDDVFKRRLIDFSSEVKEKQERLSKRISQIVVMSQQVSQNDAKSQYIIEHLFKAYFLHPQQLPDYILNRYYTQKGRELNRLNIEEEIEIMQKDGTFIRVICDHIASMTDQYAAREYIKLYQPEFC